MPENTTEIFWSRSLRPAWRLATLVAVCMGSAGMPWRGAFAMEREPLTTYEIAHEVFEGIHVFTLDGGMSAEYTVQKALANLACGISHSWVTETRGSGPRPVIANDRFLTDSVRKTVQYYDALDPTATYETVIIGTGLASVPYLSRTLKAPVLPMHFLAAFDSMERLDGILDQARRDNISAYAVAGYDPSMANYGVAWIKLLEPPPEYLRFLRRHNTRNVILIGSTGTIGETLARKIVHAEPTGSDPRPGDVYLLYRLASYLSYGELTTEEVLQSDQYAHDMNHLRRRIRDVKDIPDEEPFLRIVDWESGIDPVQRTRWRDVLRTAAGTERILFVTAVEDGNAIQHLYNYATHIMLSFYKKNEAVMGLDGGPVIRGVKMNPYLTGHPFYESRMGLVPYLFWQARSPDSLVRELSGVFSRTVTQAFPETEKLDVFLCISRNFGLFGCRPEALAGFLRENQDFNLGWVRIPDYSMDDVWNRDNPRASITGTLALELARLGNARELKAWDARMRPLTLDELMEISTRYPAIIHTEGTGHDDGHEGH